MLKTYLDAKGYNVSLAVNGAEAFALYGSTAFDFCIFDIMMPLKDGFTLASEIRSLDKKIPILFLTAKSMSEDVLNGFKAVSKKQFDSAFDAAEDWEQTLRGYGALAEQEAGL